MFPIKLTDNEYVNPEAILHDEFSPGSNAVFTLIFQNTEFDPLQFRGAVAEEAFANWKAAYAERAQAESCRSDK